MNKRIQFVTWIGLRLLGDDYDMNGLVEAIRIHSTLHSIAIRKCWFASDRHLRLLKRTLTERGNMKHVDLMGNIIVELPSKHRYYTTAETDEAATSPFWKSCAWSCMQPITCCI
jgi:hypothetical protein